MSGLLLRGLSSDLSAPPIQVGMFEIDSALRTLVERGGSDLHVKVGVPPTVRLQGELTHLEGFPALTSEDTADALDHIAEARSKEEFEQAGEADFSYAIRGLSRF